MFCLLSDLALMSFPQIKVKHFVLNVELIQESTRANKNNH